MRRPAAVWAIEAGLACLGLALWGWSARKHQAWRGLSSALATDRIAVVEVYGPIFDTSDTLRWMHRIERGLPRVKAVILDIDSPGGGVEASQEILSEVMRLRGKGLKVVASMGSECASGGYYIATGADKVLAHPGTLTGSIGVIMEVASAEKLLRWAGIRYDTIQSGAYKDTGSFARNMRPDERRVLQDVVDDVYDQFVQAVVDGRKAGLAEGWQASTGEKRQPTDGELKAYVRSLADGRVYTGRQAYDSGLVDQLGDFDDAVDLASDMAGIQGSPELVVPKQHVPFLERLTGMDFSQVSAWLKHASPRASMRLCYMAR